MKKLIFWILILAVIILSFKIGKILIFDFHRLTEFGLGYLTGLLIIFLLIISITVFLGINIHGRNKSHDKSS